MKIEVLLISHFSEYWWKRINFRWYMRQGYQWVIIHFWCWYFRRALRLYKHACLYVLINFHVKMQTGATPKTIGAISLTFASHGISVPHLDGKLFLCLQKWLYISRRWFRDFTRRILFKRAYYRVSTLSSILRLAYASISIVFSFYAASHWRYNYRKTSSLHAIFYA